MVGPASLPPSSPRLPLVVTAGTRAALGRLPAVVRSSPDMFLLLRRLGVPRCLAWTEDPPPALVRTHLQAKGSTAKGSIDVMRQVVQLDGIRGLWRGAVPGLVSRERRGGLGAGAPCWASACPDGRRHCRPKLQTPPTECLPPSPRPPHTQAPIPLALALVAPSLPPIPSPPRPAYPHCTPRSLLFACRCAPPC